MRTRFPARTANPNVPTDHDLLLIVEYTTGTGHLCTVFYDGDSCRLAADNYSDTETLFISTAAQEAGISTDLLDDALTRWENGETLEPQEFEMRAPAWATDDPEPTPQEPPKTSLEKANDARLRKALRQLYQWHDGTHTLEEDLRQHPPVRKSTTVEAYGRKRVRLEYPLLAKPKYVYTVWRDDDTGTDVPKIVYDSLDLPEQVNLSGLEEWEKEHARQQSRRRNSWSAAF